MVDIALPEEMRGDSLLSPLDDRYLKETKELRAYFSTPALVRARLCVQISYLCALSDEPNITELPPLSDAVRAVLGNILSSFSMADYEEICRLEKTVKHDVKASEYYLQHRLRAVELDELIPWLRFAVTSEDDTNLAYGLLIQAALLCVILPELESLDTVLGDVAAAWGNEPLLGHTHGQPATPLTFGQRLSAFRERLRPLFNETYAFDMDGKFGGAVGNLLAHRIAYPEVDWLAFRKKFVESLHLKPLSHTTQINPHQDVVRLSCLMSQVNTILIDFCQNIWLYLHDGVLGLKAEEGAVGSSVMPHKVNPQNLETAEGALLISNALFNCLGSELPKSRLERHLSDSHLQRWLGAAFGAHLLAVKRIGANLKLVGVNSATNRQKIVEHPEVWGEAIQTVMRRYGYADAYEQVRNLTRGKRVTAELLTQFVGQLTRVPEEAKARLLGLLNGTFDWTSGLFQP